jgi:hypothetical protein
MVNYGVPFGAEFRIRKGMTAMTNKASSQTATSFDCGTVVEPSSEPVATQTPDGILVSGSRLGPGIIEEVAKDGKVKVRWIGAESKAWMEPGELRWLGPNSHLITVFFCDEKGRLTLLRRRVITIGGLRFNWTVELLPEDIVRTVRSDGWVWTYKWNPVWNRMETLHTSRSTPLEDDEAEALMVAELAVP